MRPNSDEHDSFQNVLESLVNLFYLINQVDPGSPEQVAYLKQAEGILNCQAKALSDFNRV